MVNPSRCQQAIEFVGDLQSRRTGIRIIRSRVNGKWRSALKQRLQRRVGRETRQEERCGKDLRLNRAKPQPRELQHRGKESAILNDRSRGGKSSLQLTHRGLGKTAAIVRKC